MLWKCTSTYRNYGLQNVNIESKNNKKSRGWIKRFIQPVSSEYIEEIFIQTLIEIMQNKPSECPQNLDIIKKAEGRVYDFNENDLGNEDIVSARLVEYDKHITKDQEIYNELKRRVETILTQTFTRTEFTHKDSDKIFTYEISDTKEIYSNDDEEFELSLSDLQIAKEYKTTQLNTGYQDIYSYMLLNIKEVKLYQMDLFSSIEKKYIELFQSSKGKYYKYNEHNHIVLNEDAVAEYFNCNKSNVSQTIKRIADKIILFLSLDIDYEFESVVSGSSRELVKKGNAIKRSLTFKTLNKYLEKEKVQNDWHLTKIFNGREDIVSLADAPLFKYLRSKEFISDDNIFFDKAYLGAYPNNIIDVFETYYDTLILNDSDNKNKKKLKNLFFDAIGGGKLSCTWDEAHTLEFSIYLCIHEYILNNLNCVSKEKFFDYERYKKQGYEGVITGEIYHDERTHEKCGDWLKPRPYVFADGEREIQYNSPQWIYYWRIKNGNILDVYIWLKNDMYPDGGTLPIRYDKADIKRFEYELSNDLEILYEDYVPYKSHYLIDHGNKKYYYLSNTNRIYIRSKKMYPFIKIL